MTNDKTVTMSLKLAEKCLDGAAAMGWSIADELRALLAANPQCWPCWNCHTPITMANRADADGNCPHCEAELAFEGWPAPEKIAPVVERQEPVEAILLSDCVEFNHKVYGAGYFSTEVTQLYTSPPAPVAVHLDENVEFEKWWCRTPILRKGKLQIAQEAWEARACLDKVKEMNR
jgi:hypothetical protein